MSVSSSLTASEVEPAGDTTIAGAGFLANESVSIVVVGAGPTGDDMILDGDTANDSGAFSLIATIPTSLDEGIYTLRAIGADGSEATAALVVAEK